MAYNQQSGGLNHNTSRVYINPNFQRNIGHTSQSGSMYINPLFPKNTHLQPTNLNKPKVYVNPNFVKPSNNIENNVYEASKELLPGTSYAETVSVPQLPTSTVQTTAKSRYSIVRHSNNLNPIEPQPVHNVATIKLNKYKSVSVEQVKKNLEAKQCFDKHIATTMRIAKSASITDKKYIKPELLQNKYKFTKSNSGTISAKTGNNKKQVTNLPRTPLVKQRLRTSSNRNTFKKNNIPCPQFRKYGKCLRNTLGKCEFLHDKKHVSICRKFLNGSCYDKSCLFSHLVSAKKMPTCSFYLKGMCTKEDCPYLHVKLNEKAKICIDFLKGYCEKGVECLNRHINICPDIASKGICIRKRCPYPHKSKSKAAADKNKIKSRILNKSVKCNKLRMNTSKESQNIQNIKKDIEESDHRYYFKDITQDENASVLDTIKPTRCKLGDLPSFIEL